jgi:hypothetical protein
MPEGCETQLVGVWPYWFDSSSHIEVPAGFAVGKMSEPANGRPPRALPTTGNHGRLRCRMGIPTVPGAGPESKVVVAGAEDGPGR